MHYPGYLRYFDSAIRLLAARGHHIDLVFDNPDKQSEGTEAIGDMEGSVEVIGRMPTRGDIWAIVARDVRGTMDYGRYLHPDFADTPYLRDRMQTALPDIFSFLADRKTRSVAFVQRLTRLFAHVRARDPEQFGDREADCVAEARRRTRHAAGH